MKQRPYVPFFQKIALIALGIFLSLVFIEASMRLIGSAVVFLQEKRNAESVKKASVYRILCIGESTTALGGNDSYPAQMEKILNERLKDTRVSVINKGIFGANTSVIISRLPDNLDHYKPHLVVAMMGVNDAVTFSDKPAVANQFVRFVKQCRLYKVAVWLRDSWRKRQEEQRIFSSWQLDLPAAVPDVYDDAWAQLRLELKKDPDNYRLLLITSLVFRARNEYDVARKILERAIRLQPEDYRGYLLLATFLDFDGNYKKAEEYKYYPCVVIV